VKRKFRLTNTTDFKRVRRSGKSHAHPLVVLGYLPNALNISRVGISAGRHVGNAVRRNRAKRQIREIVRPLIPEIQSGWDIVFIARSKITNADFHEIKTAIHSLLKRASLLKSKSNVH